ncbi:MAG: hypothetical protein ACI8VW_002664, partial [bacterium]
WEFDAVLAARRHVHLQLGRVALLMSAEQAYKADSQKPESKKMPALCSYSQLI